MDSPRSYIYAERSRYSDYAIGWTVRGLNSAGVEIFRVLAAQPRAPLSPLYSWHPFLLGGKVGGTWCWPSAAL